MKVTERLEKLRKIMKDKGIDYYIIPSEDAHQSEYVCEHYRGRAYMSGFTGSAGTLLVGLENAILWTDGRYFIQALDGSGSIKINTYYSFNYFVLKIQNNGPEIPDKILNKIFDSGFTTKENKESNNGFGLAIVKELVESYNGKIQVSSTDEFTEFTIYLPTIK